MGSLASATTDTQFSFREWGQRCHLRESDTFDKQPNETYGDPARAPVAHLVLGVGPTSSTLDDARLLREVVVREGWGGGQCLYNNLKVQIMFGLPTGSCSVAP